MKKIHSFDKRGFSLIELMITVSIMAILAGVAFPAMKGAMINARLATSTADARSIVLGLRSRAQDYDGLFPNGENEYEEEIASSNDAFRSLIPFYVDSEKVFTVKSSVVGREADNRMDDASTILEPGENHFAYISGLTETSRSTWPLVVDSTNGEGFYTEVASEKGGTWEGRKAIVGYVGGNAAAVVLRGDKEERFIPREGYPDENALDLEYMGEGPELLEPAEG